MGICKSDAELYPCPCCGFLMFDEPPGSFDICTVCHWEDDPVQLSHPLLAGGANHESLWDGQHDILKEFPPHVRFYGNWARASGWRPLNQSDCKEQFDTRGKVSFKYYWEDEPRSYATSKKPS